MVPRLSDADHEMMEAMIRRGETIKLIAQAVPCNPRTVRKARARFALFEATKSPPNRVGGYKKDFRAFLQVCVETVGKRPASARGHFRRAGLAIDEYME